MNSENQKNLENEISALQSKISILEGKLDAIVVSTITKQKLQSNNYTFTGTNTFTVTNTFTGTNTFNKLPTSTATPSNSDDLVTKSYVDSSVSSSSSSSSSSINPSFFYASYTGSLTNTNLMNNELTFNNLNPNSGFFFGDTNNAVIQAQNTGWYYYNFIGTFSNSTSNDQYISLSGGPTIKIPANTGYNKYNINGFIYFTYNHSNNNFNFSCSSSSDIGIPDSSSWGSIPSYELTAFYIRENY